MIFGKLICVFGCLAPMPTPVHTSVEDITSLQIVKKILIQLYGIKKATLTVFPTSSLFGDGDGGRGYLHCYSLPNVYSDI